MTVLQQSTPMIRNFAHRFHFEFDDLYQEAALTALQAYTAALNRERPYAYLHRSIRNRFFHMVRARKNGDPLSLDTPCCEQSSTTYADLLIAPTPSTRDEAREERITAALYAALRTAPLEEQMYARTHCGLAAYEPVPPSWPCTPNYNRPTESKRKCLLRRLRRNVTLLSVL